MALAFLGDAALALVVAEHLVQRGAGRRRRRLTPRRAALVADATLARWAGDLELGAAAAAGAGGGADGGRERESILATTLEAVLGALYLEAGLAAVRRVVGGLAGVAVRG